ncbi:MAG: hypothetical protein M1821_009545 [Bathelium mastoideum]|nr:MAG: hypothetical protein M1821_009545 [Bathelium mastoideum]
MRNRLARLVSSKRRPKAGDPQPDRLQPALSRTPSPSPSIDDEQNLRLDDTRSLASAGPRSSGNSNSDNGSPRPTVQEADNGDDMWAKADKKLREDPEKREKLEKYDRILMSHLGCSVGRRSTADTRRVLAFLEAGVKDLQKDADTGLQRCTEKAKHCFQSLLECVIKLKNLINIAAHSCLPAALACAGVMVLSRLCLEAIDQRHILFEGLATVAGAIRRLTEYEQLLWKQGRPRLEEVEGSMIAACTNIIEFQARAALYLQLNPLESAIRDAIKIDGWDKLLSSIKEAEVSVRECAERKGLREVEAIFETVQDIPHYIHEGFDRRDRALASLDRDRQVYSFLQLLLQRGCISETIKNRNRQRIRGTCNWFTDHKLFKTWNLPTADNAPGLLYVTADPGCGKSVLSRYLIDEILPDQGRLVCYFFFKDDFVEQKSACSALCTLLHQIFVADPSSLTDDVIAIYRAHGTAFIESLDLLWNTFSIATTGRKVTVVLDALDECSEDDRQQLISRITGLYQCGWTKATPGFGLKFLLTSRPYTYISRRFAVLSDSQLPSIHLQGDNGETSNEIAKEIEKVVDIRIAETARAFHLTDAEQDLMIEQLRAVSNRTYLWITLLFDGLMDRKSAFNKQDILRLTKRLPQGVDEAYEAILTKSTDRHMARRLLQIVLAAEEPLTTSQMALALAFEGFNRSREEVIDNIIPENRIEETIKDYCGLFIVFVDNKVYLLHQTAREFLLRPEPECNASMAVQVRFYLSCLLTSLLQLLFTPTWKHTTTMTAANTVLAEISISYLYLDLMKEYDSLLQYSTLNWADHYRRSCMRSREIAAPIAWGLCELSGADKLWINILAKTKYVPKKGPALCLAAALGLEAAIGCTFKNNWIAVNGNIRDVDPKDDSYGRTPLSWAAGNGHEAVVRLLLETGKVDIESRDIKFGRTPLMWAAKRGHEAVVRLLLETGRVDIESKDDKYGRTPLSWAAGSGHEAVVRLLLETGKADIESKDNEYGRTPLLWAVAIGHEVVVRLLLEIGKADIESKDNNGQTPLSWAAERGRETVVRLLLKTGKTDIESNDGHFGMTPLFWAVVGGHEAIVRLLLETGKADVESRDELGRTPLARATETGHEAMVRLLLEIGKADVKSKDKIGMTPLAWAAKRGHEVVARLLLEIGKADVESKDIFGWTPLSQAARRGHETVVRLLLEIGKANVESRDDLGQTPLWAAVERGHELVVRLLVKIGKANIESSDEDGQTPLSLAAERGQEVVVRLLLKTGKADIKSKDKFGQTPLSLAMVNGHEAVVRLLQHKIS